MLARTSVARICYAIVNTTTSVRIAAIFVLAFAGYAVGATPPDKPKVDSLSDLSQWTRFRGPNGSGLSDADIPSQWTEKDFNWKTALPGGGNSSPVVYKDRVFLLCADDKTGEHMVVCVNAPDGSIRWTRQYPARAYHIHEFNSYASNSPAVDERNVYVCWSTPEEFSVLALDHDGNEIWKRDLGVLVSQHGGGQSPMVYGENVYVGNDHEGPESFDYALDRKTGKIVWKVPRGHSDKFSASTPCVYQPKDGPPQVIFMSKNHGFSGMDPATGRVIWEIDKVFDARPIASPYIADGLIFGSCGDGPAGHQFVCVKPADDGQTAEAAYVLKKAIPYVPTSIVKNGLLFYVTDNGVMKCLKPATGETVWTQRLDGNFFGSLVCARDKIFCLSKEGDAYVIAAADTFKLLARNPLKFENPDEHQPPLSTTPAVSGGRMYVRTYTHLVSIGK